MLKQIIKDLSKQQIELKKARKTGPYKEVRHPEYGWILHDKMPQNVKDGWRASVRVTEQKVKITAALNLLHEMKGSSHRHNYDPNWQSFYDTMYMLLKQEITRVSSMVKE